MRLSPHLAGLAALAALAGIVEAIVAAKLVSPLVVARPSAEREQQRQRRGCQIEPERGVQGDGFTCHRTPPAHPPSARTSV